MEGMEVEVMPSTRQRQQQSLNKHDSRGLNAGHAQRNAMHALTQAQSQGRVNHALSEKKTYLAWNAADAAWDVWFTQA